MNSRDRKENTNYQIICNIVSVILINGINFFTIPVFTRMLGTAGYGKYSLFSTWVTFFSVFMGIKVSGSLGVGKTRFGNVYKEFRSSLLLLGTLMSGVIIGFCLIFISALSNFMGFSSVITIMVLLTAFSSFVINFANTTYIYEKEAGRNLIIATLQTVFTTLCSMLLIYLLKEKHLEFEGRVYGVVLPQMMIAIALWCIIFFDQSSKIKKKYAIFSLKLSGAFIWQDLSKIILIQSDRVMMQKMCISDGKIGIYSFAYTFSTVLTTILSALNNSWIPYLFDYFKNRDYKTANKRMKNYIEVFTIITCGFLLLAREVMQVFVTKDYWSGIELIPMLVVGVFATFLYQFPLNYEVYMCRTNKMAFVTSIAAGINIILNYFMIPRFGISGAAFATMLSYLTLAGLHFVIVYILEEEKYPLECKSLLYSAVMVGICSILFYVFKNIWIIRWSLGVGLGIVMILKVYKRKQVF